MLTRMQQGLSQQAAAMVPLKRTMVDAGKGRR
jgi:hypothetical protein